MNWNEFTQGLRRGTPVGMGYLSVSFGFGTLAASQGIRVLDAALISATNVTSAGQFAGLTLILAAVLYLGQEVYAMVALRDNVANFMHLVGGVTGTVFGVVLAKRR